MGDPKPTRKEIREARYALEGDCQPYTWWSAPKEARDHYLRTAGKLPGVFGVEFAKKLPMGRFRCLTAGAR